MEQPEEQVSAQPSKIRKRPFICTLALVMALTYFLILTLLFLSGLIFSGSVNEILDLYASPDKILRRPFSWLAATGTVLFLASTMGIVLMMMKRKTGFYLFISALLLIMVLDFFSFRFDWLRYLIHSGFFFIMGLVHFTRKCYKTG